MYFSAPDPPFPGIDEAPVHPESPGFDRCGRLPRQTAVTSVIDDRAKISGKIIGWTKLGTNDSILAAHWKKARQADWYHLAIIVNRGRQRQGLHQPVPASI